MNVLVSSSPAPRAHPPRSNPFLRSSDAWPFPCITPSMVTWVMVVSFTFAAPCLGAAHVGGLTPATNTAAPIRHPLADFLKPTSGSRPFAAGVNRLPRYEPRFDLLASDD